MTSLLLGVAALTVVAGGGCRFFKGRASKPTDSRRVESADFVSAGRTLALEFLADDVVAFEYRQGAAAQHPFSFTPMVDGDARAFTGPTSFERASGELRTSRLIVRVDESSLCFSAVDKASGATLTRACPEGDLLGITLSREGATHAWGLGQHFVDPGSTNGDWMGRVRASPGELGNVLSEFRGGGGAVGDIQIPVAYFAGSGESAWALYYDNARKQTWDLQGDPMRVRADGGALRGVLIGGQTTPRQVRARYLELTGRPPLPPKRVFGLWMSEFSYAGWDEMRQLQEELRAAGYPLEGFQLDLLWFGGVSGGDPKSNMGALAFDPTFFPDAARAIAEFRDARGLALMPIEESYVATGQPAYAAMKEPAGSPMAFLAHDCGRPREPVGITGNGGPWWGAGGMIDWTNPAAGDAWHDLKRAPLAAMGIHSHWIDLGEPEMYAKDACYHGHPTLGNRHWDVHNVYNLFWAASIWRGYERSRSSERPFIAARSGAAGIQRYGVGIWSGDIGGSLRALSGHLRAQAHMSWSGVDYYTSDIGGFHRKDEGWRELSQEAVAQNYTIWFANGMMFDYPARPHVWNMDLGARGQKQGKSTAPTRVGHGASNLANARLRYELSPYVYTQAWRAATTGAPLLPPLALAFPTDMAARSLGDVKMLGEDLLVGVIANADVVAREVHLPAGRWIDWHSLEAVDSRGQLSRPVPVARDGLLRLPIFARAGAIVPTLRVDDRTLNVLGQRSAPGAPHLVSSETASAFRVRVFTDPKETNYTHYEDDGISTAHRDGRYRTTGVKQSRMGSLATVTISGADDHGASYLGAPNTRARVVELASPGEMAAGVKVNGSALAACPQGVDPEDATAACYVNVRAGLAKAAVSAAPVGEEITFAFTLAPDVPERAAGPVTLVCRDARTAPGEAIYVVGSAPALGAWDPAKAIALKTFDAIYPHWAVQVDGLPPGVEFEWKCFKAKEDGASTWQISTDPKAAVLEWSDGNAKGTSTPEAHDLYSKKF